MNGSLAAHLRNNHSAQHVKTLAHVTMTIIKIEPVPGT